MTNASIKNSFAVLSILVLTTALSLGAFASTVHAQDDAGYADTSGDNLGYADTSGDNYGYADTSGDNLGYADTSGDNLGYADTSGDNLGYADTSGDNLGYADTSGDNLGYADTGNNVTDTYDTTDVYGNTTTEENGVGYSYENYSNGASTPSYSQSSQPFSISAPGYTSFSTPVQPRPIVIPQQPIVYQQPVVYQQPIQQQQQQQQQQQAQQPVVINNTNTNTNVNTNTAPVYPVAQTPVTYPVQYTYPQPIYPQPPVYPNYQNVSCTITAAPNSIQAGQYSYLTWQSYGATYATLTNYGNVAPNGSLSIQPNGSMNYVLTVYGQNGQSATCNTYVTIANIAPYVTLSQIPYTGFDFGTFGDSIYWASLVAFAIAAGYLMIYFKGGMFAFAGSMIPARRYTASTVAKSETVEVEPTVEAPSVAEALEDKPALALADLPVAQATRPTMDSMSFSNHNGAPRLVISRS